MNTPITRDIALSQPFKTDLQPPSTLREETLETFAPSELLHSGFELTQLLTEENLSY
jgi:hypothetical protein